MCFSSTEVPQSASLSQKPEESISRCSFHHNHYQTAEQQSHLHFNRCALLVSGDGFYSSMCGAAVKDNSILGPWCFPGVLFRCRGSGAAVRSKLPVNTAASRFAAKHIVAKVRSVAREPHRHRHHCVCDGTWQRRIHKRRSTAARERFYFAERELA